MKSVLKKTAIGFVALALLGGFLLFKISPKSNVESIGYQYAVREDISNLPNLATPQGYTSLNAQSIFSGHARVRKLARSIADGKTSDLDKVQALTEWVQLHVRPQTAAPTTVVTDDYVNIIKRGWGYCDQMAHVFATMATYVGLDAEQLQLYRNDGISPHTLAMVKIDGKWVVVLTWRGIFPKDEKGIPYTLPEFITLLKHQDAYGFSSTGLSATEFENAKVFKTYPYLSNAKLVSKVFSRVIQHTKTLFSSHAQPSVSSATPLPTTASTTSSSSNSLVEAVQIPTSELTIYNDARDAHLDLDFKKAILLYDKVLNTSSSTILKDEALYQKGMALFDSKKYKLALGTFEEITTAHIGSAWGISARRMTAETLLKLGKTKNALSILDTIDTIQSKVRAADIRNVSTS